MNTKEIWIDHADQATFEEAVAQSHNTPQSAILDAMYFGTNYGQINEIATGLAAVAVGNSQLTREHIHHVSRESPQYTYEKATLPEIISDGLHRIAEKRSIVVKALPRRTLLGTVNLQRTPAKTLAFVPTAHQEPAATDERR
ncbi:MAG: hypothetical protein JWL89_22 [Candidatus Saccharibacteria bacterium]|nr:hypothetical protein [Candidatus Saccharibacteria bacterium]